MVLRTGELSRAQAELLNDVQSDTHLDFWKDPAPGRSADIMTSSSEMESVMAWLASKDITAHTMVEDVEKLIQETRPSPKSSRSEGKRYAMDWDDYHDHDTLNEFIAALADANDFASIIPIGQSYEGRDMNVLAITKAGAGAPNIWLEAGIHAREWIAPAVATFIVRELVEDFAEHPDYLDKINWYFIPSANPDGYQYSFDHDRLWRKTRSDHGSILGCKGVDPNRNWGFHYGESGVSHNKCQETYCGPEAFSEVEIQKLAIDASDALYQVHGTVFDPINSADLYPAAGASDDWYKSIGMRYSFTTELRDTGRYGFVLPADQIIPSGEEMWAGFEVVIKKIIQVSK